MSEINLEVEIKAIIERNKRVELEKAWETSKSRKFLIVLITYLLMCLTFYSIGIENYFINAIVPTLGYFLSTLSLSVFRDYWIRLFCKK